jgi:hypothetical protein
MCLLKVPNSVKGQNLLSKTKLRIRIRIIKKLVNIRIYKKPVLNGTDSFVIIND